MSERIVIFVLGMGRSGSSALTRVLSLCGASLPEKLVGSLPSNPRGHWEPQGALVLNTEFLARYNGNFHDPTLHIQADGIVTAHDEDVFVARAQAFLESCPAHSPLVIKEPRITMLAPYWLRAAQEAGFAIRIVIPVRHPSEVAASLAVRDNASLELSVSLWLKCNLLAERASRDLPRVFVAYTDILQDWRSQVARIARRLSVTLSPTEEVDDFLTPTLRHERADAAPPEIFAMPWIGRVYEALSMAANDEAFDCAIMDEIYDAYRIQERTFRLALSYYCSRYSPSSRRSA